MDMSVLRYLIWLLIFDCWEILPGQLGSKLLFSVMSMHPGQAFDREGKGGFGCEKRTRKEGGILTFARWMFIMRKTIASWQAFPSLPFLVLLLCQKPPFPFEMPATQAKWCQSNCLRCLTFKRFAYFTIFWGLEVKYILLDHGMYLW